jgi:hypothetical protein
MGSPGVEPLFLLKRQVLPPLGRPRVEPLLVKKAAHVGDRRDMWGWADGKPPTGRIIILLRNHKVKDLDLFCLLLPKKGCGHTNYHQCKWLRQVVYG